MKTRTFTRHPITAAIAQLVALLLAGLQPTLAAWLIPPGATSGDGYSAGNGYDYLATANWNDGTIDDNFSTLGLTGALTISLNSDRPTTGLLNMTLTGASDFSLLSDGATSRAITLGGDVTADVTDGNQTITIGTTARPVTINLNNAARTFTVGSGDTNIINGVVSSTTAASGKLIKAGTGTLVLTTNPTYTGFTTINAGTLQLGNGGAGGVLSSSSIITNNGSLVINHTSAQTLAAISGTGSVTMAGSNNLTLNAGNTFSGGFTLNSGAVNSIGSGTYAGFGSGTFTVTGGTLWFNGGSTQTITNSLNWQGTLVFSRSAGATPVTTWTGPLTLSNNLTLQMGASTTANNSTFTNNISGAFGITITGPTAGASLTLSGANNTFSGGLNWNSANVALNVNSATALGTGTFTIGAGGALNNTSGGAITLANNNTQAWNATSFTFTGSNALNLGTGAVTLGANVTATVSASTLTVGGAIGQTGGTRTLTKNGAGTLELSGSSANTYGGLTTVSAGTLLLNKSGTANAITATGLSTTLSTVRYAATAGSDQIADTAPVTLANGGAGVATLDLNGVSDTIGSLTIGGASGTATGQGVVQTGAGTLTLNGNLAYVSTGQGAVTHTISGNLNLGAATRTFSIQNNAAATELDIQAAISGSPGVGITKTSSGQMQLAGGGINTYTGLTDIQAGSILYGGNNVIADAASIKVSGGTLDISTFNDTVAGVQMTNGTIAGSGGVLTSTSTFDMQAGTVSAILGGSVGLTKTNSGTLYLNGVNTYTGPTVVSAGTLGGTGTIAGTVNASAGAALSPGASAGTIGTLTLTDSSASALTLNGNNLLYDLPASGTTCDLIAITGTQVVNGVNTVLLNVPATGLAANTYTLMTYAATTGTGSIVFQNGSTNMGNATLAVNASNVTLTVAAGGFNNLVWKGNVAGLTNIWDTTTTNWTKNTVTGQAYTDGDFVTFDDSATTFTVTNTTTVTPGSVTVNNSANTYTIPASIGGSGALFKSGGGTVSLTGSNTFSGGIFLNGGVLQINSAASLGDPGNLVTFTGTSTLNFLSNTTLSQGFSINAGVTATLWSYKLTHTFTNLLAGSGTLNVQGQGDGSGSIFEFASLNNTFSGDIRIYNSSGASYVGELRMNSLDDTPGRRIRMGSGGNSIGIFSYGAGAVVPLVLSNRQIELTAGAGGYLNNNATNVNCTVTVNTDLIVSGTAGNRPFTLSGSNIGNNTFAGAITNGTGYVTSLTKSGNGAWVLSGTNTYSGATAINGGTLSINSIANVAGGASAVGAPTNAVSGTIAIGSGGTAATLKYTGTGHTSDRVINLAGTTGGATLDQSGSGLLKFTSAFTATGAGAKTLTLTGSTAGTGEIAGAIVNSSGATALTKAGAGTWILSGSNTYSGATAVSGGTLLMNGSLATGVVATVASGATLGGTGTINRAVNVNSGGILRPGDSTGILTINSNLTIAAGATNLFALGTNSASVAVSGNLTMNGAVTVNNAGGLAAGTYTLFTYGGSLTDNGITVNNPLPGGYTGTIDTNTAGQVNLLVTSGTGSLPVASFTVSAVSGVEPLQVVFTDTSTGSPTGWGWSFGDSNTSTLQNPTNVYAAGSYTVSLVASNVNGASSPYTTNIYVITLLQSWTNFYGVAADGSDNDGDGVSNLDEFKSGFSPINSNAYLRIISVVQTGGNVRVTFLGSNGDTSYPGGPVSRANVLEYTTGTANGGYTNNFTSTDMTNVLSGGTGSGVVTNFVEISGATNGPARYYRVRVHTP